MATRTQSRDQRQMTYEQRAWQLRRELKIGSTETPQDVAKCYENMTRRLYACNMEIKNRRIEFLSTWDQLPAISPDKFKNQNIFKDVRKKQSRGAPATKRKRRAFPRNYHENVSDRKPAISKTRTAKKRFGRINAPNEIRTGNHGESQNETITGREVAEVHDVNQKSGFQSASNDEDDDWVDIGDEDDSQQDFQFPPRVDIEDEYIIV